jgi:hypothetical protein
MMIKLNSDTAIVNGFLENRPALLEKKRKEKEQEQQVGPGGAKARL